MSTNEEPYQRYERLKKRGDALGWVLEKDPAEPAYRLVNIANRGIYRPAGPQGPYGFTLDEVERQLDDLERQG